MKGTRSLVVLMVSLVSGVAWAQDTEISGELESMSANMTPDQKLAFSEDARREIDESSKRVAKMLEQAQKEGAADDVIQCLTNKLASIRALQEVTGTAELAMKEALATNQQSRAGYEFRKIAVSLSKVRQFVAEAEACIQTGGNLKSKTFTEGTQDETLAESDVPDIDLDPDPPDHPHTSPFE